MGEFHQHPDGFIYVRAEDGALYADTKENFVSDAGLTLPALPDGADDHIYTQDRRHAFMGNGNVIEGGPVPWDWGDAVIARVPQLLAAQDARKPAPAPVPPVPTVPQSVTPRQARLALFGAGLLDQVTAAVNAAGGPTLISWEYASVFERTDPLIATLAASLNLTAEQLDALFTVAATL